MLEQLACGWAREPRAYGPYFGWRLLNTLSMLGLVLAVLIEIFARYMDPLASSLHAHVVYDFKAENDLMAMRKVAQ